LRRTIQTLTGYDAIVLDVAPSVDLLQVNALVAADVFIVPVALEYLAVVGASEALRSASSLAELGEPVGRCVGILPTFLELTTRESQEQLAALVGLYQKKNILWFPIPKDTKAREAPAFGKTLWEHAPDCRALAGITVKGKLTGGYRQALSNLAQSLEH
jgi:chromosome partitioning protein